MIDQILDAVRSIRLDPARLESNVVDAIKGKLDELEFAYEPEAVIGPGCRVDLLVGGGIAIEVKKGKPNSKIVAKQVERYAESDKVSVVILVSERGLIHHINEAHGKRIEYVALSKNWGLTV